MNVSSHRSAEILLDEYELACQQNKVPRSETITLDHMHLLVEEYLASGAIREIDVDEFVYGVILENHNASMHVLMSAVQSYASLIVKEQTHSKLGVDFFRDGSREHWVRCNYRRPLWTEDVKRISRPSPSSNCPIRAVDISAYGVSDTNPNNRTRTDARLQQIL